MKNLFELMNAQEKLFLERAAADMLIARASLDSNTAMNLASVGSLYAREKLAGESYIAEEVLLFLSQDKNVAVRMALANRLDLPESVAVRLASDRAPEVREALAYRADLSDVVQSKLETDEDESVRAALDNKAFFFETFAMSFGHATEEGETVKGSLRSN